MDTKFFSNAIDFLAYANSDLKRDEVRYGLISGIAKRLVDNPHQYGEADPWFCGIGDDEGVHAVAIRTPPYKILLAQFSGDLVLNAALLADSISAFSEDIPGVVGDKEIADCFAEYWSKTHRVTVGGKMAQRIYRLVRISDIRFAAGNLRLASESDRELVTTWANSFQEEAISSGSRNEPVSDIISRIKKQEIYLWEDNNPVSMAAKSAPTDNGIRINLVYTPPQLRRRGYATTCVASICKSLLDSGYKFCTLYTDLANPTSNSIYKKIGFEEVCDSVEYTFAMPSN